jgi:hypothetical protein
VTKVNSDVNTRRPIRLRLPRTGQDHTADQYRSGEASIATSTDLNKHVDLMSPDQNVQRIMWTGTIWFAAAVASIAITMGMLLSTGWRPALLVGAARAVWWVGAAFVALSIGLIGWSGCPILEVDVPTASKNKSLTMQLGTMLFIVGSAAALFAVLLGPAG